ncbi:hypothetical protein GCM10028819_51980 [Spirosoma humi]
MKLLLLIASMAPESGGPATEVVQLTNFMVHQEGVQVTVACPTARHQSLPLHPDVQYVEFENPVFPTLSWWQATRDLKQLIQEHDLVITSGIWGPIDGFALRLAWQPQKPVYIRVCGMLEDYIVNRHPLRKQIGRLLYVEKNLNQATGLIFNSKSEAHNARKPWVSPKNTLVIPNGVNITNIPEPQQREAKRSLGLDAHQPVLLYLGRMHPKKGLHVLLQAMALLPVHQRTFSLLIAGEYSDARYKTEIENLIEQGGLSKMVRFSGLVTGADKERHFQAADSFILPSQSEGVPMAVLEAMAYGLPVIITRGCNIPEVADYGAGLVVELSVDNLTKALQWFTTGGDPLSIASDNAIRLIRERFSPEQSMDQYKQILANHTPDTVLPYAEHGSISS